MPGYNIVRVTADNAERHGYPAGDRGLKVRYLKNHLADADSLPEAAAVIAAYLARHLVLVEEAGPLGPIWEAALTAPRSA